ncbi:MAG: DUF58 domain-containing protein, partial [Myxococcales bacterium]|nr:DUF58 domain-containing protein [Myxococcales bacterium]
MNVYPTRTASHLAVSGLVVFAIGIAARVPAIVAWGGALVFGVALARAVTLVSVMRIRAAGFEMLWNGAGRLARVPLGSVIELEAEVRNRDTLAARYDRLRVVASPALECAMEPPAGEVMASGSVRLRVRVRPLRVGYHGIYGLALEVRGAPSLFEVPLTFANPFGVEVLPRALGLALATPVGGRARAVASSGRSGNRRGDGTELRELREHLPGDPFRRIAWKASAKRGVLVVREFEREERDVVWVVLDASVELWGGPMGGAPLDRAIEMAAAVAAQHLGNGDLVGLRVIGGRELARLAPDGGRRQLKRITTALLEHTGVHDTDRSGWDEGDLALQVVEHLRPLDPRAVEGLGAGDLEKLARRASAARAYAPFDRPAPQARSQREARLRRYAACFGLHVPPRLEPDRPRSAAVLRDALLQLAREKRPRASLVHVVGPPPPEELWESLAAAARKLRGAAIGLRWSLPPAAAP